MRIERSGTLVVGGASGLGEAAARCLHGRGAQVAIADVNEQRGHDLARELGDRARFVRADVTRPEEVEAAVAEAASVAGGLFCSTTTFLSAACFSVRPVKAAL